AVKLTLPLSRQFFFSPAPAMNMLARMDGSRSNHRPSRIWLAIECAALFLGVPAAYYAGWLPIPVLVIRLLMPGGCWLTLRLQRRIAPRALLRANLPRQEWRRILIIYSLAVPGLAIVLWLTNPSAMFWLIRRSPGIWLLVMVAYPLVSVVPQELIYRA